MKICAISDMHGQYDFKVEPCDIVLICGDIVPLKIQFYSKDSEEWLKTFFIPWCNNLPCEKVVFVAGNHDFLFQRHDDRVRKALEGQDKIVYLNCEYYEYNGKVIYGTPWCKPFGNWAFMETIEESEERYKDVKHFDILISHDAPYGISDILLQKDCWWADGSHIGNIALTNLIERVKPEYCWHGHLHSTNRDAEYLGNTRIHNASLLDENYEMVYEPLYIEL
jgi:Icc-related predicted phosphoesterase